jgi:hypothetical protein
MEGSDRHNVVFSVKMEVGKGTECDGVDRIYLGEGEGSVHWWDDGIQC